MYPGSVEPSYVDLAAPGGGDGGAGGGAGGEGGRAGPRAYLTEGVGREERGAASTRRPAIRAGRAGRAGVRGGQGNRAGWMGRWAG